MCLPFLGPGFFNKRQKKWPGGIFCLTDGSPKLGKHLGFSLGMRVV
jgi:hypothetical protein